jgi:two-component system response regulator YesN
MESTGIPAYLDEIRQRIEDHLKEFLNETDLAGQFNVSVSKLQHDFTHFLGCNFQEYQTKLKMEAAKKLLTEKQPIKRIAREVGYNSGEAFSRAFKRITGKAPSAYRKNPY